MEGYRRRATATASPTSTTTGTRPVRGRRGRRGRAGDPGRRAARCSSWAAAPGRLCLPLAGPPTWRWSASTPARPCWTGCGRRSGPSGSPLVEGDMADFDSRPARRPSRLAASCSSPSTRSSTWPSRPGQQSCLRGRGPPPPRRTVDWRWSASCPASRRPDQRDAIELRTLAADRVVLRISHVDPAGQTSAASTWSSRRAAGSACALAPPLRAAGRARRDGRAGRA